MKFEWHSPKAESNLKKHGVSFEEAVTVFQDADQLYLSDESHSFEEERYFCIGFSSSGRLLSVTCTERSDEVIRIISARVATREEEKSYGPQNYYS